MLTGYTKNDLGVIEQTDKNFSVAYDLSYVQSRYDTYGEQGRNMAHLRLGYIIGAMSRVPASVLDVGYGNGDFLRVCRELISDVNGNDISQYPLPEGCNFVADIHSRHFDVVCFFDSLEHFTNIDFVQNLDANYVVVSLPWCHYLNDEWFTNWKHRRPGEHFWHFNDSTLPAFMKSQGYECISLTSIEDLIRKPKDGLPNILSAVFKRAK